jgi:F-type H+-transporting ATPase subunit beta
MSTGKVVNIIGAVVDVQFPRDAVPKVYFELKTTEGKSKGLVLEVQQILGGGIVRTIALDVTSDVSLEERVENMGKTINEPVRVDMIKRMSQSLTHRKKRFQL